MRQAQFSLREVVKPNAKSSGVSLHALLLSLPERVHVAEVVFPSLALTMTIPGCDVL